jgi:hypothetical protein
VARCFQSTQPHHPNEGKKRAVLVPRRQNCPLLSLATPQASHRQENLKAAHFR